MAPGPSLFSLSFCRRALRPRSRHHLIAAGPPCERAHGGCSLQISLLTPGCERPGGLGGRGDGECSLCPLIGRICWQPGGRLGGKSFGPCQRQALDACMVTLPSPAPPVLPLPSISGRSAIQRAGRGCSLHLLGEALNGSQELHKAHQRCLRSDLHKPSGPQSWSSRGAEGREDSPSGTFWQQRYQPLSVSGQPAQHLGHTHQCPDYSPNPFSA